MQFDKGPDEVWKRNDLSGVNDGPFQTAHPTARMRKLVGRGRA